ncbi:DUF3843 family protein [Parabacteroides sp. AM08-6]|uniref:DUF3843 family protein n=1 Tax=Parabacteroides sp. AM08-6 TaxID=2292053 RepID=UPI000F0067E3|nr:DUF3843 family protein [Parabacteroides sp. AM08-6]RHJ85439.1 DUF3843 family protein [Parabacteroides sp. AM08-6]
MKNIKIYPKDWLQLHPYKQSTPIDLYYTNIANQIYDIMEQTRLAYSFEKEEVSQICIRIAAYFEDVISRLNIWRSFILEHKRLFGNYLPFYIPDDHYYDDEVNYEDICFLIWHYIQQYYGTRKGTFVSPDNETSIETARLVYQLFCDEWATAPENEQMQKLFAPETRYDTTEKYNELLYWFHYNSYLTPAAKVEMTETFKTYSKENPGNESNTQVIMIIHDSLAHISKTPFLAYTSPKWLSLILPETHPDHENFVAEGEKTQTFVDPALVENQAVYKEHYDKFITATEGKLLVYFSNKRDFLDFITNKLGLDSSEASAEDDSFRKFAIYATPTEGLQVLTNGIEYIKDEHNPFYDKKKAESQALSFFIVHQCSVHLLKELEERDMLADAQIKSQISPERGKAIIHENWQFLSRYFLRDY